MLNNAALRNLPRIQTLVRGVIAIVCAAGLAACAAKPLEVGSITQIKPHTGSGELDVYAPKRAQDPASAPEFSGDQLVEVRTYRQDPENGQVEMEGATCKLSAALFSADMTTPAKVRVPLYRGKSSELSATCSKPGFKDKLVTAQAFDVTRSQRFATASGGGVAGVAVVAVFDAFSDNTKNDWKYPVLAVVMEEAGKPAP